MILNNLFKTLYNIGHIIYYRLYNGILYLIDVELPIPSLFNPLSNDIPSQIDKNDDLVNDYIDSWDGYHITNDENYIKEVEHKPYDGPYCETP